MKEDELTLREMSAYELIDKLDKDNPHRCITEGQSVTEAHRYAGARQLIDLLVAMAADEKSN